MPFTQVLEPGIDSVLLVSIAGEDLHLTHNGRSGITDIHIIIMADIFAIFQSFGKLFVLIEVRKIIISGTNCNLTC